MFVGLPFRKQMLLSVTTLVLMVLLPGFGSPHPIHMSVTDLQYRPERKVIEISIKLFTDDLQQALGTQNLEGTLLQAFTLQHVQLELNGKPVKLRWVNQAHKADNISWCYLEAPCPRRPKTAKVSHDMLMETFADQRNIVYASLGGRTRSLLLEKGRSTGTITP